MHRTQMVDPSGGADYRREVLPMSEQPQGCTGERCKVPGTYSCESGHKQFYNEGDPFGPCPETGRETRWVRVT